MFINIHSHKAPFSEGKSIINLHSGFDEPQLPGYCSMGIHPWYIDSFHWENDLISLGKHSDQEGVLAIGECGLDKLCDTPFPLQETVFRAQVSLAVSKGKPMIIHCVRAWEEIFFWLKKEAVRVPVIFHGFNKRQTIANRIIESGYYVSFGKALLAVPLQEVFATLPADRIFLETDDAGISIATVYDWAAKARGVDINSLSLQIQKNAAKVFGSAFAGV